MDLNHTLINREALNERIRLLQTLRQNPKIQFSGTHKIKTDGWVAEELEEVLSKGINCLSEEKLNWLSFNPVALSQIHDAINEEMPDAWYGLMVEDAKELWNNRPLASRLKELAVNRDALNANIRELQKKGNLNTDGWTDKDLESVLDNGIQVLSPDRQNWLINNPVALFQLFEAVNEEMPDAWMPAIQADANRLAIGNIRLQQKGEELFELIKNGPHSSNPESVNPKPESTATINPAVITGEESTAVVIPLTSVSEEVPSSPITTGKIPTGLAAAGIIPSEQMQTENKLSWPYLITLLEAHLKEGQVTTYRNCSLAMFRNPNTTGPIIAMLEAAANRGYQKLTNRVVNTRGECKADHHGQKTQLKSEGVPFIDDVVDLSSLPPVKLPFLE